MGLLPEYIVLSIYVYLSAYHLRNAGQERRKQVPSDMS